MFTTDNPWTDEPTNVSANAIGQALVYAKKMQNFAQTFPTLKTALLDFSQDLEKIAELFKKSPNIWRQHRALTVVHLPALTASLEGLEKTNLEKSDPRRLQLEKEIKACLKMGKPILEGQSNLDIISTQTQTELLLEQTGAQIEEEQTGFFSKGKSLLSQTGNRMGTLAASTGATLKKGTNLTAALAGQTLYDGVDYLTTPLSMRYNALRAAVADTGITMLIAGGLTTLIFPPAAPLIAGLVVLESPQAYKEAMEKEKEHTNKRRQTQERTTLEDVARLFWSQPKLMRLETDHIIVRIDTQTGESDGTILSGRYTGQTLSEIDKNGIQAMIAKAPDLDTQKILASWLKGHNT